MLHTKQFPNENNTYRDARNTLLDEEIALRRHTERVAQMRRDLPLGGKLKEDYIFEEKSNGEMRKTKLSSLFAPAKPTLVVYSMMYHPNDENACPACTSIVDGLDGAMPHIRDKINFAIVTKASNGIFHTYGTELLFAPSDPGQHSRHVDSIWPIWNVFDFTPEGRDDWFPKFQY